jgi:hypothetical protein
MLSECQTEKLTTRRKPMTGVLKKALRLQRSDGQDGDCGLDAGVALQSRACCYW